MFAHCNCFIQCPFYLMFRKAEDGFPHQGTPWLLGWFGAHLAFNYCGLLLSTHSSTCQKTHRRTSSAVFRHALHTGTPQVHSILPSRPPPDVYVRVKFFHVATNCAVSPPRAPFSLATAERSTAYLGRPHKVAGGRAQVECVVECVPCHVTQKSTAVFYKPTHRTQQH